MQLVPGGDRGGVDAQRPHYIGPGQESLAVIHIVIGWHCINLPAHAHAGPQFLRDIAFEPSGILQHAVQRGKMPFLHTIEQILWVHVAEQVRRVAQQHLTGQDAVVIGHGGLLQFHGKAQFFPGDFTEGRADAAAGILAGGAHGEDAQGDGLLMRKLRGGLAGAAAQKG